MVSFGNGTFVINKQNMASDGNAINDSTGIVFNTIVFNTIVFNTIVFNTIVLLFEVCLIKQR